MQNQTENSPFLIAGPVSRYVLFLLFWVSTCIALGLWLTWFFSGYKYPVPEPTFVSSIASWKLPTLAPRPVPVQAVLEKPMETKPRVVTGCNRAIRDILQQDTINFATGSAKLSRHGLHLVERLVKAVAPCEKTLVEITGHTDNTGLGGKNIHLSAKRAEAVADAMQALGMLPSRFRVSGVGSSRPVASNATVEGRYKNRRIEVRLYE